MRAAGPSLSFVLLAYDERDTITAAIEDCRAVAERSLSDHEIIVVDDGSRDGTGDVARAADRGDVRVIRHADNLGMGASMRDGYRAARCDYMAHLPGDRQVHAEAIATMLPRHGPDVVVRSLFTNPPSGRARAAMSIAFRLLARHVGGLRVDFAGSYLFHRAWLDRVELARATSDTFLFSFQLLELMRRAGARFETVHVPTYPRQHGASREATPGRIARMVTEIARARLA